MRTTSPSCQYTMLQTKTPKGKVMLGKPAGLKTMSRQSVPSRFSVCFKGRGAVVHLQTSKIYQFSLCSRNPPSMGGS